MSLVEVLVVLAIVAVMGGAVALSFGGGRGEGPAREARLLADRLTLAADAALATGRGAALHWDEGGYRFEPRDAAAWAGHPAGALAAHELGGSARLGGPDGAVAGRYAITPDLLPSAEGALRLTLAPGDAAPAVTFDGANATVATAGDAG